MIPRRRLGSGDNGSQDTKPNEEDQPRTSKREGATRQELRRYLIIDKDDLDTCIARQPDLYFEVSEQHDLAVARRDKAKLDLEEAEAAADLRVRRELQDQAEGDKKPKITEAAVANEVADDAKVRALKRTLIDMKSEADLWGSMKEGFGQRSYMLRELVAKHIAQLAQLGVAGGSHRDITEAMASRNRAEAGEMRRLRDK